MSVLKAPHHVVPTQSVKTFWGGTSATVCLVSLLPLEITGSQEIQVVSSAQVMLSGMGLWGTVTSLELGTCASYLRHTILCLLTLLHCSSDINECLSSGVCQGHAECINTLGSYKCRCQVGFIAHNSICEGMEVLLSLFTYLIHWEPPPLMIM